MSPSRFWRDPALPYAECRRADDSRACYVAHAHDTLSVGMVERGASRYRCPTGEQALQAGSVVMVPAGVVHACNPLPGRAWSYRMLHLDAAWCDALWRETGLDAPLAPVVSHTGGAALAALTDLLFSPAAAADKEAALVDYVGGQGWHDAPVAPAHADTAGAAPHPGIARVVALLRADCACVHTLAALAAHAGLSRYHFIRAFHARTGMTPHAYQTDQRIQQARRLLRAGAAPARVAHDLGFADQSHFQRVFKARVAVTPGQYRAPASGR